MLIRSSHRSTPQQVKVISRTIDRDLLDLDRRYVSIAKIIGEDTT